MRRLRVILARAAGLFTGKRADAELAEELRAHLEMEIADNVRRGMNPSEARRAAFIASGGLTVAMESVREQRGIPFVDDAVADLRYAARVLRRSPAFSIVAVLT